MNVRQVAVLVLMVAGIVIGILGILAVYVRDTVIDSDEFATRAADALADPVVGALIAEKVIDQVVEAEPDALAVRPLLEEVVLRAVGAPAFRSIYEAAIRDLHRTVFLGDTDTVSVQLTDMVLIVRTQATVLAPELSAQIPDDITDTLINVQSHPATVEALQFSEDVRFLAFVLPLLALVALGAAFLLAADRRNALVLVGLSVVVIGVVLLVLEWVLGVVVVRQFEGEDARAVAGAFWSAYASDLGAWALVIAGSGATLVASVWWLSEPIDVAARLRQMRRFVDPPQATLPRVIWVASWAFIGVFLILRWQDALRLVVTLFGVIFLVNALAELLRMVIPQRLESVPAWRSPSARIAPKWLLLSGGVLTAALVGGFYLVDRSGGAEVVDAPFNPGCNGHVLLCDRRFDDVTIAATHNSMSSAEDGFLLANHSRGIVPQLEAGYRGLLIDLHYGLESDRTQVVVTDRAPLTPEEREDLVRQLGAAAVRSAEELRRRHLDAEGTREAYLCHALCELGATRFSTQLTLIREWLDANPREVLLIIIEDKIAPEDVANAFEEAGLIEYLHVQGTAKPWPTLGQMIDSSRRVVVMAENDTGGLPWYHGLFALAQETPYSFETFDDFNCEPNRGRPDNPLLMINHWVTPALAEAGAQANSLDLLTQRVEACHEIRGRSPNILAVDFYAQGDALAVVETLNGLR